MGTQGSSGTYFYSPDIRAYIDARDANGNQAYIDISADIISFNINRAINSTSSAQIILNNQNWKYTPGRAENNFTQQPIIETMDRIVIFLKRESWLQCFTGYIIEAPILTLIPQPISITAYCTLYRVQNSFWDINNPEFQRLLPGVLMQDSQSTTKYLDGGGAQGMVNLLTKVVGWNQEQIHISALPTAWIANSTNAIYQSSVQNLPQNSIGNFVEALDGAGIISGNNLIGVGVNGKGTGNYVGYKDLPSGLPQSAVAIPNAAGANGAWGTVSAFPSDFTASYSNNNTESGGILSVPGTQVKDVVKYYQDSSRNKLGKKNPVADKNQDPNWWCVIPWGYFTTNMGAGVDAKAMNWLSTYSGALLNDGRPILLTSIANANQIVVRASIAGNTGGNIVVSPQAFEALAGDPVDGTPNFYTYNQVAVTASWADPTQVSVGVQDNTNLLNQLASYNISIPGKTIAETPEQAYAQNKVNFNTPVTDGSSGSLSWLNNVNYTNNVAKALQLGVYNSTLSVGSAFGRLFNDVSINSFQVQNLVDWCALCLALAGFPVTEVNVMMLTAWVNHEQGGVIYNGQSAWAANLNPLGSKDTNLYTDWGKAGTPAGAFPSLLDAAKDWAWKMLGYKSGGLSNTMWDPIGAVFDSEPRYNKTGKTYTLSSGVKIAPGGQFPSAYAGPVKGVYNHPTAERPEVAFSLLSQALHTVPWDGTHYTKPYIDFTWPAIKDAALRNPSNNYMGVVVPAQPGYKSTTAAQQNAPVNNTPIATSSTGTTPGDINNKGQNFNTLFTQPTVDVNTLTLFGTPRAFVTDQPVLNSIATMASSSLRQFQSSPTGDFVAWFPDYFGLYGQAPTLNLYDIEILDFQLYHNDTFLTTHVAISGDPLNMGQQVSLTDWMTSNGIVSVQIEQVMANLFNINLDQLNQLTPPGFSSFADAFLARYGMRPLVQEQPNIRSHVTEFFFAWQTFLMHWANQYTTQVSLTFMPELYPGMRIRLADHNIEVYVQSVSHQGSRSGGFSTNAQVTCPVYRSTPSATPTMIHYGFPYNPAKAPSKSKNKGNGKSSVNSSSGGSGGANNTFTGGPGGSGGNPNSGYGTIRSAP